MTSRLRILSIVYFAIPLVLAAALAFPPSAPVAQSLLLGWLKTTAIAIGLVAFGFAAGLALGMLSDLLRGASVSGGQSSAGVHDRWLDGP